MKNFVLAPQTGRRHLTSKIDQINADSKGNWHQLARKKTDKQAVCGSVC
jgi:hypothetical protein